MTVDGMPGLEGYYFDYGRPLKEDERVRFVVTGWVPEQKGAARYAERQAASDLE